MILVTESTFSAFYPYNDATTDRTKVCLPSLKGQDGSWENIQKYDFMVAEVTQAYGEDGPLLLPAITLFAIFLVWCNLI